MNKLFSGVLLAAVAAAVPAAAVPAPEARPLSVREAVRLALDKAPEIAVARSAAAGAEAVAEEAGSASRPQLFVSATPGYSTGLPLAIAGEAPAVAGASVRMTLYDASLRSAMLDAKARVAGFAAALWRVRADVVARTVAACAKLNADSARAAGARLRVEAREAMARGARALFREGRSTELEADRAALDEARARQKLDAALSDLDLDRYELARLVGFAPGTPILLTQDPAEAVPQPEAGDALAAATARDATLKALAEEEEALARSAKLLAQIFKPTISAEARYAYAPRGLGYDKYYLSYKENVASLGVSVVLPLLTGGRDHARAAQTRARLEHAAAQRRVREEEIASEVRTAQAAAERMRLESGLARRGAALAEEQLRQARAFSREGRGEAGDVDRAQIALVDAEEEALRAAREEISARLSLLVLTGELLPAFEPEPQIPGRR